MLCRLRIRLTSPMLGARPDHRGVRVFDRCGPKDKAGWLDFSSVLWRWAVQEAVSSLHLKGVQADCIQPPVGFPPAKTYLYTRRYRRGSAMKEEMFEAISSGAVLTLRFAVTSPMPNSNAVSNLEAPDNRQLESIFKFIGLYLGFSPWGNKFKYGRFSVLSVEDDIDSIGAEDVVFEEDPDRVQLTEKQEDKLFSLDDEDTLHTLPGVDRLRAENFSSEAGVGEASDV